MPAKSKVPVEVERLNLKLPKGLHDAIAKVVTEEQLWPSRQDFIIDALREKLERLEQGRGKPRIAPHKAVGPRAAHNRPTA